MVDGGGFGYREYVPAFVPSVSWYAYMLYCEAAINRCRGIQPRAQAAAPRTTAIRSSEPTTVSRTRNGRSAGIRIHLYYRPLYGVLLLDNAVGRQSELCAPSTRADVQARMPQLGEAAPT